MPWPLDAILNIPANMYDGYHPGTIFMNVLWTCFNLMVLGVATAVAWEQQQRRQTVRVTMAVPAGVILADGTAIQGITADLSSGGVMLKTDERLKARVGDQVQMVFPVLDGDATLPATVVGVDDKVLRAHFDPLTTQEEEALTMVLYSRADTWLGWGEAREVDRPLLSMWRILQLSAHGLSQTIRGVMTSRKNTPKGKLATSIAPVVLMALSLAAFAPRHAVAQAPQPAQPQLGANGQPLTAGFPVANGGGMQTRPTAPGTFDNVFTLADANVPSTMVLRGVDSYHSVYFAIPHTELVKTATMTLRYHFSPGLLPDISHLKVSLNGTLFATIPVRTSPTVNGDASDLTSEQKLQQQETGATVHMENSALLVATITMPAELLVHDNELTFEFIGHYTLNCEDPSHSTLWSEVDPTTSIELQGNFLTLQNDLKLLPLPFYDQAVNQKPVIPIVFATQPSPKALQAAGIITSWFGILTNYQPARFPVSFGTIPAGNAIVISESATDMPVGVTLPGVSGPTVAMQANPNDPYSKILIVTGSNSDDLLKAAQGLAMGYGQLAGPSQSISGVDVPKQREPDDAPRWMGNEHAKTVGDISQQGDLQGDGTVPVGIYSRLPPDLYYGDKPNLAFNMSYRYNGIPLAEESSLQIYMNGAYVSSTPMPHTNGASQILQTTVPVPVVDMRPFSNTMQAKFIFQIAKKGHCQDTAPMNLQGAILRDSELDISAIPHWTALPNLEIFANAGYPFTRRADLSETAVVLPDNPSPEEIEVYLTLMGHFGAQTGYPVLSVEVTNADGMKGSKDFLVIGTMDDSPAIGKLGDHLPVQFKDGGLKVQQTSGFFNPLQHAWWKVQSSDRVDTGKLETTGGLPDAVIEGIESPYSSGNSVVLVALRDKSVTPNFLTTFLKTSQSSDIQQSVSVLDGTRFNSYRLGNDLYHVGTLHWWTRINMQLTEYPWLIVIFLALACFLMAALLRAMLRRHARRRLQASE